MEESDQITVEGEGYGKPSSISMPIKTIRISSRQGNIESLTPATGVRMLEAPSEDSRLLCKSS